MELGTPTHEHKSRNEDRGGRNKVITIKKGSVEERKEDYHLKTAKSSSSKLKKDQDKTVDPNNE